jgi:hypothetical protein
MKLILAGIVAAMVSIAAVSLHAQSATPDSENGRYLFQPTGDDVLRLDTRTGQVSVCGKRAAGWACEAVPDERTALESEIARLQGENANLKRTLLARGIPLPNGMRAPQAQTRRFDPRIELKVPSDEEVEAVVNFMEKMLRRLMGVVQEMPRDKDKKG